MNKKSLGLPVLACAGWLVAAASCGGQRATECAARGDDFAAKYILISKTGDCDELAGEVIGLQTTVNNPDEASDRINSIAIRPAGTGEISAAAAGVDPLPKTTVDRPTATGKFSSRFPDGDNHCTVARLSPAEVDIEAFVVPGPDEPVTDGGTDGGEADGGADGGEADGGSAEGGAADGGGTEGGAAEGGAGDGPEMDGAAVEAGGSDGGSVEGGAPDAGASDAEAATDAPAVDAGPAPGDAPAVSSEVADDGGGDDGEMMCPGEPPEMAVPFPATHVKYEFSNVVFFVNAAITGGVMSADLKHTTYTGSGACVARYRVRAVSPVVSCLDCFGNIDESLCTGYARAGIPSDINIHCDHDLGFCVLNDPQVPETHVP